MEVADLLLSTDTLRIFHRVPASCFSVPSFWAYSLQTRCFQALEAEMERFGVTRTEVGGPRYETDRLRVAEVLR